MPRTTALEKLKVLIGVDIDDLQKGISTARGDITQFSTFSSQAFGALKLSIAGAAAAIGASLLVLAKSALDEADAIGDAAAAARLSVKAYQEYAQVLSYADITTEEFNSSTMNFLRLIGQAEGGNKKAAATVRSLGLELRDVNGVMKTQDQLFQEALKNIGEIGDEQQRAAAAAVLFGESAGAKLAGSLAEGSAAIEEQRKAVSVYTEEQVKAAGEINDRFSQLTQTISVKLKSGILTVIDAVRELNKELDDPGSRARFLDGIGVYDPSMYSGAARTAAPARRFPVSLGGGAPPGAPAAAQNRVFVDPRELEKQQVAAEKASEDARKRASKDAEFFRELNVRVQKQEEERRKDAERGAVELNDSIVQAAKGSAERRRQLEEDYLREGTRVDAERAQKMKEQQQLVLDSLSDALVDIGLNGEEAFERIKQSALRALAEITIRYATAKLFGAEFGTGGSAGGGGGDFASAAIPLVAKGVSSFFGAGFASGGRFRVGGSGGTDSQMIGMRLTPGEMVNVERPGPMGSGGAKGGGNTIIQFVTEPGMDVKTERRTGSSGEDMIRVIVRNTVLDELSRKSTISKGVNQAGGTRRPPRPGVS